MAKRNADARAAAAAAELRGEREQATAINNAIAATESEIFDEAMGDEPLSLDGDRSLEAMADDIGDEDAEAEGDEELDDEEATDSEVDTEIDPDDEDDTEEGDEPHLEAESDRRGQDQRGIPPGRVREMRQRDRAQSNEESERLRYDLQVTQARLNDVVTMLGQRGAQPDQQQTEQQTEQQASEPPDMFADPDGFREYVMRNAQESARAAAQAEFQTRELDRVEQSLQAAAAGPRRFEFQEAYRQLTSLPRNAESARLVRDITSARDPATALFEWFEANGAEDFRADIAEQLGFEVERPQRGRDNGRRPAPRQRDDYDEPAPRHEVRLPQSMQRGRMPSLNEARGASRSQRDADPRGFDGSDSAIFDYASR